MRVRLGDDIDDFCVKCKRVMNHLIVSMLDDAPAKVRCRTCHGDHDFRHEQAPPPKIDARKAALIQQAIERAAAEGNGAGQAIVVEPVETVEVAAAAAAVSAPEAAPAKPATKAAKKKSK
jgi:cytochrome c553